MKSRLIAISFLGALAAFGQNLPPTITSTSPLPDATQNAPYTFTFSSTFTPNQTTQASWSVPSGTLPQGLGLSTSGVLSGTPSVTGSFTFPVTLTIFMPISVAPPIIVSTTVKTFTLTVNPPPAITSTSPLPTGDVGTPYSFTFTSSGGSAPITWSTFSAFGLGGLTLNPATGVLSGTPTTAGTGSLFVTASDRYQSSSFRQFSVVFNPQLTITTTSLPNAIQGAPYSTTVASTGGTPPLVWSLISGAPPGISMNAAGVLSGTPSSAGAFTVLVQVADAAGAVVQARLPLTVIPRLAISTASPLPTGEVGLPYSVPLLANGGVAPLAWVLTAGALPSGLTLAPNGTLAGTPGASGTFTFTAQVTDSGQGPLQQSASGTFSVTIAPRLTITSSSSLPTGTPGVPYSFLFTATGGVPPLNWSIASGALPSGVTLNAATGALSGAPSTAGVSTFTIQVTDALQVSSSQAVSITSIPTLVITSGATLPSGIAGAPYSVTLSSSGGTQPITWSIVPGSALPPNLALTPGGVLTGTPTTAGTFTFALQASDNSAVQQTARQTFQLTINATLSITSASPLPAGEVGLPYSVPLLANGGVAPLTWAVTTGSLPSGLALSANGTLAGTPVAPGTFTFTAQVTDSGQGSLQQSASGTFSVTIAPRLTITSSPSLPAGTPGAPYTFLFTASGGVPPLNWSVASGVLPAGLTLNAATGALTGATPAGGVSTFTIQVTDALQVVSSQPASISVVSVPTLTITTGATLPSGVAGVPYSLTFAASGGTQPVTWSMVSGSALPAGLALTTGGVLSGTPTAPGSYSFTLQASDNSAAQQTARQTFQLTINSSLSITSASPLPGGIQGAAYAFTFSSSGGTPPVTWSVVPGTILAPGLTLNSSGVLGGAPSSTGTFNFTIQAMDSAGATAAKPFTLAVAAPLTITSAPPLPTGTAGSPYSFTFAASGGVAPLTWSIASGSLPAGVTLNASTGALSGTPGNGGTAIFTIQVTDNARSTASQTFSITVNGGLAITTASPLPSGTLGMAYSLTFAASGATAPLSWAIAPATTPGGGLPPGLALDAAGNLTGTPSQNGSFNFTVTLTDGARQTASKPFALTINTVPLSITTVSPLPAGIAGTPYSVTFAASGGTQPFGWSVADGVPPAGVTLTASGVLAGTPMAVGTFNFSIAVSDAGGNMQVRQFQVAVSAPQAPQFTIGGIRDTETPNNQPQLQLTLGGAYPLDIAGQLTLTFDSAVGGTDQMVRFANGSRQVSFTVPAGSTTAVFSPAQIGTVITGTVAGTITLSVTQFQAGGVDIAPVPAARRIQIAPGVPVITSLTVTRTAAGFDVQIVGFSTPRQVTQGRFQFAGANLGTNQLDVNVDPIFAPYYQSAASAQFGSQFTLLQSFNVQGDPRAVQSLTVVLTNGQGSSQASSATLP